MPRFKPQYNRLLFIDRKIREGRYPNCATLAREWEVSSKTIQRDIDYMRYTLDAPIKYSRKKRGYFYTEEQYRLPAMQLKESDLFAVFLADKLLVQYQGTPVYDSLKSVFSKIENSLPQKVSVKRLDEQKKFTVIPPFQTETDPDIWDKITSALRESITVTVNYKTPGKKPAKRQIDPYHAVRYEGAWYIAGFCHSRNEVRIFHVSRMLDIRKTGEKFSIPEEFDFSKFSGSHFGIHLGRGDIDVKIRFDASVADYVTERKWHPTQKIKKCDNGDIMLELTVNHLLELKRWILSWGEAATVLEPEYFASEMKNTLEKSLAKYDRPGLSHRE